MDGGLSASDIALMNKDENGNMGGMSFFWIFALLILAGGGGLFGNNGGRASNATVEDMCSGFNFNGVNNKLDNLMMGQANLSQTLSKGICDSTYETNMNIKDCCCTTQRAVDQVRYDMTVQNGELRDLIHAEGDATRAMIQQNKIESLQQQVNQLQMDKVACGIPKLNPYAWGVTPIDACHTNNNGCCGY